MKIQVSKTCQIPSLEYIYQSYFKDLTTGIFVEVGAADGETCSNTSCLADLGWRGVYIEPIREMAEMCLRRHIENNVKVFNCAIDSAQGEVTLNMAGLLTTGSQETIDAYASIPWAKNLSLASQQRTVSSFTLEQILRQEEIPNEFELLCVDVEGYEKKVFESFDINVYNPKMIIVELCDVHPDLMKFDALRRDAKSVREMIKDSGYIEVFKDHINTVFLASRD